jgi:mono/diheme cytochrome c family protein
MKYICWSIIVLILIGCGNAHRPTPQASLAGEQTTLSDPRLARGRHEFMLNCNQCHPDGAAGLAPSINDKPLPEGLIKVQIREGLGAMPAFKEEHLNDQDVEAIVRYLKYVRDQRHVASS